MNAYPFASESSVPQYSKKLAPRRKSSPRVLAIPKAVISSVTGTLSSSKRVAAKCFSTRKSYTGLPEPACYEPAHLTKAACFSEWPAAGATKRQSMVGKIFKKKDPKPVDWTVSYLIDADPFRASVAYDVNAEINRDGGKVEDFDEEALWKHEF